MSQITEFEKIVEKILELVSQHTQGQCSLCGASDYPVRGNKKGYGEVYADEAEEWHLDHLDDCPVVLLPKLIAAPKAAEEHIEELKRLLALI